MSNTNKKDQIDDYLDGELPEAERAQFEAELAASDTLRQELEQARRASGHLRDHFQANAAEAVDDEGCAIAVEQIVRMSTQELRRADVNPPKRRSPFMIFALAIALLGLGMIIANPFINHEPSPNELVANAAKRLNSEPQEFQFSLGSQLAFMLDLLRDRVGLDVEVGARLRIGPRGLVHVLIEAGGVRPMQIQAGFDGEKYWFANEATGPIYRSTSIEDLPENPLIGKLLGVGFRLRETLEEARTNPAAVELVGRVEDELGKQSWKVHLGGSKAAMTGDFWFDDEGNLERFGIGPILGVANPKAEFGVEDFRLDRILPGIPVEDVDP